MHICGIQVVNAMQHMNPDTQVYSVHDVFSILHHSPAKFATNKQYVSNMLSAYFKILSTTYQEIEIYVFMIIMKQPNHLPS